MTDPAPPDPLRSQRHRLVVCTDLTSATAGLREPDDAQSLIRLLLCTDMIDLEGVLVGSNLEHGQVCRPELAHGLIGAYAAVRRQLLRHDPRYPHPDDLHALVATGQPVAGRAVAVSDSIGPGRDTAASTALIAAADRPDPRPLWVALWGGGADLAQALWRVVEDRGPEAAAAFRSRLRIHAIGDQDSTCAWIKERFPDLPYITRSAGYRGLYRGGEPHLCDSAWVARHLHGHGPLGDAYPDYRGGDVFSRELGPVTGIKEGDTPSFLGLIPNGLHHPEAMTWGGWGGRLQTTAPRRWTCAVDRVEAGDPRPEASTVRRWRAAFQADFAARMRRCVEPPGAVPIAPSLSIEGPLQRRVERGQRLLLRALVPSGTPTPTWHWYHELSPWQAPFEVSGTEATLTVPEAASGEAHCWIEAAAAPDAPRGYARVALRVDD